MARHSKTSSKKSHGSKESLLSILEARFEKNRHRHQGIEWKEVQERLKSQPKKREVLQRMEDSGGEPDVVARDMSSRELIFMDCSAESPSGRRSLCYDEQALSERKENKPKGSALAMASAIGIQMLNEKEYHFLQTLEDFDLKTSSWVLTPPTVRERGGALFCDNRYGKVFLYHNGAPSYYAARGFRGSLRV